jgi:DNA mismatch repair protein MutS2
VLDSASAPDAQPHEGDTVKVRSVGIEGVVLEIDEDEVVVQRGAMRTRVPIADVELVQRGLPERPESAGVSVPRKAPSPGIQIDLRGQTVEEALHRLGRYLDEAAMAALPWVRIIHGKGTGTLRREVRRFVGSHPLVVSYDAAERSEGGDGATVAHLVAAR